MKLKCPKCGISYIQEDQFCRKCGVRIKNGPQVWEQNTPFEIEVMTLIKDLKEFRSWMDQSKINVHFMRAYKEKIDKEIGPHIITFTEKYKDKDEGRSTLFSLIMETFSWLNRPITFMETELRPSIGMGGFLERWMMTSAVESYLKECCQNVDHHLDELQREIELTLGSRSYT